MRLPNNKFNKIQPVSVDYLYQGKTKKVLPMIDNYIYLYHTSTLIAIPTFPESIADSMSTTFATTTPLSRSAPIYSFTNSGPRTFQISLILHRDLMNEVNGSSSNLKITNLEEDDYIDYMIRNLQAMALPRYSSSEKMVNPPIVAVRFGEDIFCKGVIQGGVTVTYAAPVLRNGKYAQVNVDFTIHEIDPYDADSVSKLGSFRGINTDLERRIYK